MIYIFHLFSIISFIKLSDCQFYTAKAGIKMNRSLVHSLEMNTHIRKGLAFLTSNWVSSLLKPPIFYHQYWVRKQYLCIIKQYLCIISKTCISNRLFVPGIYLDLVGAARVHWTERHTSGSGKNRRTRTVHYSANETYFTNRIILFGSKY